METGLFSLSHRDEKPGFLFFYAIRRGLSCAQNYEGGPKAQLYIQLGGFEREMFGSYESGYIENDGIPQPGSFQRFGD